MAHVAFSDVLTCTKNDILSLNVSEMQNYMEKFINNIQLQTGVKISDFDITLVNNKIHHREFKPTEKRVQVGQDMVNTIEKCLKEKGCNVAYRNVKFEDCGKRYISVVANKEGGIEIYPVKGMNMELAISLNAKNAEEFMAMQPNYKMRYQDLVQDDNSNYLQMLRGFQQNYQETKKSGAHYAPPEICSRTKKNKDGTGMNIDDYPSNKYRGMNAMM